MSRRDRDKRIFDLHHKRWTQEMIADEVGCSPRTVGRVLGRLGAGPQRRRRRSKMDRLEDLAAEFKRSPALVAERLASGPPVSEAVAIRLLFETKEIVVHDHSRAAPYIAACRELFREKSGRAPMLRRRQKCHLIQVVGIEAARLRMAGEAGGAETALTEAIESETCVACLADIHRRLAAVRMHRGLLDKALDSIDRALNLYTCEVKGIGHDLNGCPLAACLALRAEICMWQERFDEGARSALEALQHLHLLPDRDLLRISALSALAWCQLRMPGRLSRFSEIQPQAVPEASKTISEILEILDAMPAQSEPGAEDSDSESDSGASAVRATTFWVSGALDATQGRIEAAKFKLGVALDDFTAIPMRDETVMVAADLGLLERTPRQIIDILKPLGSLVFLVPYAGPLRDLFRACQKAISADSVPIAQKLMELRDFAGARVA